VNILKKSLAITVATLLSSGFAFAQSEKEDRTLHNQAAEYKMATDNSIVTEELINNSIMDTQERDTHRGVEEMNNLEMNAIDSIIKKIESSKELAVQTFIFENVPASVLASGEKAVAAYIQTNFIDKKGGMASSPEQSIEVIWGGTDSALSIPEYNSGWDTVVKPVVSPTQIIQEEKQTSTKNDAQGLSDEERDMIKELGLTEQELLIMMGGNANEKPPKEDNSVVNADNAVNAVNAVEVKDVVTETNVVISEMTAERVVIMGKLSQADVDMEIQIIRGDKNRKIQKSFDGIKPGFLFEIDGTRFEFVSLNKNQIVFENLNTNKTFRSLLN
jgi:hypothetical protein